ncbi:hypothetical protein OG893_29775 [Streptomyces sp. NBC_01696]|uniref:hypothetical protein n=1 Tax=Streptomyces sp. NBC_01696 TaxID=2975913 RepID=UPI002E32F554|nr:hypothetical protein [Streptomyces sp. NBC_01696]
MRLSPVLRPVRLHGGSAPPAQQVRRRAAAASRSRPAPYASAKPSSPSAVRARRLRARICGSVRSCAPRSRAAAPSTSAASRWRPYSAASPATVTATVATTGKSLLPSAAAYARSSASSPEPVGQPGGQAGERERTEAGRGQLQGERQAVQAVDDAQHFAEVLLVDAEPGAHGGRPLGEQAHGRRAAGLLELRVRLGQRERAERDQGLAVDRRRFPAGGQHPQPGADGPAGPGPGARRRR